MLKAIGLVVGSLLAPSNIPEGDMVRYEVAAQMRKMIGLPDNYQPAFSSEQLRATPKNFCRTLLCDYHKEVVQQFAKQSIEFEALQAAIHFHKQKIIQQVHSRRLSNSERIARTPVKQVVRALAHKWKIKHPIRVINMEDIGNLGSARILEVFIDEDQWEYTFNADINVLTFIAGHELAHIYYEDLETDDALEEACKKNISNDALKREALECLKSLHRFTELRADVSSATDSKRALKGYETWTALDLQCSGNTGGDTYPYMSERSILAGLLKKLHHTYHQQARKRKLEQE